MLHPVIIFLATPDLYLDPGSGSFLIQMLLAALMGIGVAVKLYWNKIKTLFRKKTDANEVTEENDEA